MFNAFIFLEVFAKQRGSCRLKYGAKFKTIDAKRESDIWFSFKIPLEIAIDKFI